MKKYHLITTLIFIGLLCSASSYKTTNSGNLYSNGYLVYDSFEELITAPQYKCYQYKAVSSYRKHICRLCNAVYFTQEFKDVNGETWTMYSNSTCSVSKTGYHDHLNLTSIYDCTCITINFK